MGEEPRDEDLFHQRLAAARAGDESAVTWLCERYEARLQAHVRRQLAPHVRRWVDAADLVQRVLFETFRGLDGLPPGADESELLRRLYRTARSRMYDASRKHRDELGESVVPEAARDRRRPEPLAGTVTRQDTRRWLEEALDRLPAEAAAVLRLCALDGLSFVEAGRRLGVPADTLRKRYERARELLARRLRAAGDP